MQSNVKMLKGFNAVKSLVDLVAWLHAYVPPILVSNSCIHSSRSSNSLEGLESLRLP